MDYKSLKVSNFENTIGASTGTIAKAIKNDTDLSSKWLTIILEKFDDLNPGWLLTGKGDMIKAPESSFTGTQVDFDNIYRLIDQVESFYWPKHKLKELLDEIRGEIKNAKAYMSEMHKKSEDIQKLIEKLKL